MDSHIQIGQKHYRWILHEFLWLSAVELQVTNLVDPEEELFVSIIGKKDFFTKRVIEKCIELAVSQGWYSQSMSFVATKITHGFSMHRQSMSLVSGKKLCDAICHSYGVTSDSFDKSKEVDVLNQLTEQDGWVFPMLFQQLYIERSGNQMGPDYGFLSLPSDDKRISIGKAKADIVQFMKQHKLTSLPFDYIPFLYWGTDIYSLLHTKTEQVFVFDPNLFDGVNIESCLWVQSNHFSEWLQQLKNDISGRSIWMQMYQIRGVI